MVFVYWSLDKFVYLSLDKLVLPQYDKNMLNDHQINNLFWTSEENFQNNDPHLSQLKNLPIVHPMDWWKTIDFNNPGICILTGGRQIGKSTSLKLLIQHVLSQKLFAPSQIFYLTCDMIFDPQHLMRTIKSFLNDLPPDQNKTFLLLLDEVTFVPSWDRVIKALADEGIFRRGFCILTGSDTVILKQASSSFPGRRGSGDVVDFHVRPLSFVDYVRLVSPGVFASPEKNVEALFTLFDQYLLCGGFLRAMNDLAQSGKVTESTFQTFEQWLRGDFLKRGKSEELLLSVLKTLVDVGVTQNSYSGLTQHAGNMSKETFIDYCWLLERMDVLFTLEAFDQNTLRGFPKKAMKFHFWDPFIARVIQRWLTRERMASDSVDKSNLVELSVAANCSHHFPTYYIKAEGEVDVVAVVNKKFYPIEVKWTGQVRSNDLKQIKKYKNSFIVTKGREDGSIENVRTIPLPLFLLTFPQQNSQSSENPSAITPRI